MDFNFSPIKEGMPIVLNADQVKADYILVIKGVDQFYIKHKITKTGYYVAISEEASFLNELNIKITQVEVNDEEEAENVIYIPNGLVEGSNFVTGSNNKTKIGDVSVSIIGNGITVEPKVP